MKLLHTADWHIGRTLNGYDLLEEQKEAFRQILEIALAEKVDGVIIAGDLYDRAAPSADSVIALNNMLKEINLIHQIPIYAISGNHDGARRLNYGKEWMKGSNLHLHTFLEEAFQPIELDDLQIFLLPFFDPIDARIYFSSEENFTEEDVKEIKSITDAMPLIVEKMQKQFDPSKKHLLITHFAVSSGKEAIELTSETTSTVGGLATLSSAIFSPFDYVALGHIHTKNASPARNIRYSGSPVKFNIKEARIKNGSKGVYLISIKENEITTEFKEIQPKTDLIVLEESFETLTNPDFYKNYPLKEAWFAITVMNFEPINYTGINIRSELQKIYGEVVELDYETQHKTTVAVAKTDTENLSEEEVIASFYDEINGQDLTNFQKNLVEEILVELRKEKE